MLTVEGRAFFAVSATPVTVDELLIFELTDPRAELDEEEPAEAVKEPTPAPTPPPTRAASTAAVRITPPPYRLLFSGVGEVAAAVARYP